MIILHLVLFCALFTLMVKVGVGNNATEERARNMHLAKQIDHMKK